jgi:hypothetical protein
MIGSQEDPIIDINNNDDILKEKYTLINKSRENLCCKAFQLSMSSRLGLLAFDHINLREASRQFF